MFLSLAGGKAGPSRVMAPIAGGKPISGAWNSTLSKMSAFTGRGWIDAVQHWTAGGGKMTVRDANLTAGDTVVAVTSGALAAGAGGRLSGALDVTLRGAPKGLAALAEAGVISPDKAQAADLVVRARQGDGDAARASITFQAGETTLGPIALGPAPRVYTPGGP